MLTRLLSPRGSQCWETVSRCVLHTFCVLRNLAFNINFPHRPRTTSAARSSQTCHQIVSIYLLPERISHQWLCYSAANDFWGKTYLSLTGESKMNQQLAILTGSSAGATESFVVVPFELVKIRCVSTSCTSSHHADLHVHCILGCRTSQAHTQAQWT